MKRTIAAAVSRSLAHLTLQSNGQPLIYPLIL
jgi:hypothetical protein